jgi:hypothetical protein
MKAGSLQNIMAWGRSREIFAGKVWRGEILSDQNAGKPASIGHFGTGTQWQV